EVDHLLNAIDAVNGQHCQDAKVQDEDRPIESIELIKRADVQGGLIDDVTEAGRVCADIAGERTNAVRARLGAETTGKRTGDHGKH
ncbi:MAG: hypothetical protein QOI77_3243, partial [Blastocatellia bacterium]|nr:hypothetical protein [Blastocatellia bacterium]